jgi:hypothetical protein
MRTLLLSLSLSGLLCTLPAQGTEWVTNGSFTGTLAPWTMGGAYSVNPGLDPSWDTTGMGVNDSYGVNAGGQVFAPPHAPNTIEQQIVMVQGLTYEFRADLSGARPAAPTVGNVHIGRVWVEVDSIEIARVDLGGYTPGEVKRAQIVGRHVGHTNGAVTLRIFFQRDYLAGSANPRMNLDNVSLRDVTGPTYWLDGNRHIGATVQQRVAGDPGSLFATFVSLGELPAGVPIPGIGGLLGIDPVVAVSIGAGLTDATGAGNLAMTVPNDPAFLTTPLYYQAVGVGTSLVLSLHFGCVFTQ